MNAVLFISHGSKLGRAEEEISAFVNRLKQKSGIPIFEYAFLEIASPSISEGIDICADKGAKKIVVLLNFLNSGQHVNKDIPQIIDEARKKHPGVDIQLTEPVGQHEGIGELFLDMINKKTSS